jgi:hypothetical protein
VGIQIRVLLFDFVGRPKLLKELGFG